MWKKKLEVLIKSMMILNPQVSHFLGLHMADLLTRIKELDDKVSKSKLIEEYHSNQQGYYDKDTGGTRTRVNAAIRIIKD
jgi:hypothetical protein